MERRNFIKQIGAAGLGVAAMQVAAMPFVSWINQRDLKKWVWITPGHDTSTETWKSAFEMMKLHGVHGVLVQVYSSHQALYPSTFLPNEYDELTPLIKIGKETGIEVHAWMWTMPNNNPDYIENHPNWYVVNRNGEPANTHPAYVGYYRFMCPNNPEVQEFLRRNVRELASFEGLSGVHLDYIRMPDVILAEGLQPQYNIVQDKEYPQYDYCYCETCRHKFKEQTGLEPLKDIAYPPTHELWRQFRYDSVTHLVNDILAPEIKNAGLTASAAVFPNWESVRQQWSQWNLDAYFPMLYNNFYNAGPDWIGEHLKREISALKNPAPVYAGLFVPALNPSALQEAILIASESNAQGFALFSFNSIAADHWKII
jgi:uncharacterized lipoprotein YddW (UPF0748 family)